MQQGRSEQQANQREAEIERFLTGPLDCDEGRRLGCSTYCCSLIVRLEPGERDPTLPEIEKRCIDKCPASGVCIHLGPRDQRCGIYPSRPAICRAYDCRTDPLLKVVLREGFESLVKLVTSPLLRTGD